MDFDSGSGWVDSNPDLPRCHYCGKGHEGFADCAEGKSAFKRMQDFVEERKHAAMEIEQPWPPEEYVSRQWKAHGLDCAVVRGEISYCGYVRVPSEHPDADKFYDDVSDVEVHGGLTFTRKAESKIGGGRWFGFDTGHYTDWWGYFDPKTGHGYEHTGKIWTEEDVVKETEKLARQFAAKLEKKEDGK